MLDFIVLGRIPGTQIQVTYGWFIFGALCTLAYIVHKIKHTKPGSKRYSQLKLFN